MTGPPTTPEPADAGPLAEQTDERSERADWRSTLVGAIAINVVAGLWLIVSPAPLDYESAANAIIWGAAILVINLVRLFAAPTSVSLAIVSAIAGGLTVISGVLFSEPPGELINLIVIGGAVVVLSLIALAAGEEAPRSSRP